MRTAWAEFLKAVVDPHKAQFAAQIARCQAWLRRVVALEILRGRIRTAEASESRISGALGSF